MLTLKVGGTEYFDESSNKFYVEDYHTLQLEHSLASLSKWESKWETPFFGEKEKTTEQVLDYIRCMDLSPEPSEEAFKALRERDYEKINEYINQKMTATWFNDRQKPGGRKEVITAELMYYWLVALQIDWEVQYWHVNRLLTLVRVVNEKNKPQDKKKTPPGADAMRERARLNAERRAQSNSGG